MTGDDHNAHDICAGCGARGHQVVRRDGFLCFECKEKVMTGDADFDATLEECFKVLGVKGQDYTVGSKDRLANFNRAAELLSMRPEQVLAVYWYKHVAAVLSYIKTGGQSESEPIEGRIADNINYMLLFGKMVAEKKRTTALPVPRRFKSVLMSSACVKCGKTDCTVNDESWCFDCFSNVGALHCVECKKPAVLNAVGYCHNCAMKPELKWLHVNVDKP